MKNIILIIVCSFYIFVVTLNLSFLNRIVSTHTTESENDNGVLIETAFNGISNGDSTARQKQETAHNDLNFYGNNRHGPKMKYNATEYQILLDISMNPLTHTNYSTAWLFMNPWAGLCNQYMMFIGAVFVASGKGHKQIIEQSVQWKDTYGHEQYLQHSKLFDIVHWNSFYPQLPRFIRYERDIHSDIKVRDTTVKIDGKRYAKAGFVQSNVTGDAFQLAKNPIPIWKKQKEMFQTYKIFAKTLDSEVHDESTASIENMGIHKTIMQGAFKPHPEIQSMIDGFVAANMKADGGKKGFMVLHARVEPDMQNHPVCKDKKVRNMTDIVGFLYTQYPEPPVLSVVLIFNRDIIEALASDEDAAYISNKELRESFENDSVRQLTIYNLQVINDIIENGLWDGRVQVLEAGSRLVEQVNKDPWYRHYSNLVGGILNFFLAIQSDVFVGTEVSSYSSLVASSRFYRGLGESYFYRPRSYGLNLATAPNAKKPHRFAC